MPTSKRTAAPPKPTKKPRLKHVVCKPCWELKYCPYGPLVEFFPLLSEDDGPEDFAKIERSYQSWINAVKSGELKTEQEIFEAVEKILCLQPERWQWISQFRTSELSCSVFGHVCPVFFSAEPFTETKDERRTGRSIPREVMLKVVRRDGQVCATCRTIVPDNEIEFDHVIPVARGGPTTPENLRILCRACNRKKSDALSGLLHDGTPFDRPKSAT